MARKKSSNSGDGGGGGDWLNTYADMVTLLLTFFILLFSMSTMESEKWEVLIKAFANETTEPQQIVLEPVEEGDDMIPNESDDPGVLAGEGVPDSFNDLYEYVKEYVEENDLDTQIELQKIDNNVFIRVANDFLFEPYKSTLKKPAKDVLDFLGTAFSALDEQILGIRVNGHTATVPGTTNYTVSDRELSSDRANAVVTHLESSKQVDPKKMVGLGYGRNYPIVSNDTTEGRSKNRRVDILVMGQGSSLGEAEQLFAEFTDGFNPEAFEDELYPPGSFLPDGSDNIGSTGDSLPSDDLDAVSPYE